MALSVGLAACGGGSSTTTMMDDDGDMMPDPAIAERAAIKTAIDTASTAVAAVGNDSTDAQVMAADAAIAAARKAITDAANVPATEKAANTGTVNALASRLTAAKSARQMAMDDAQKAADKAMAAAGKALHGALGSNPVGNLDATTLSSSGLVISTDDSGIDDDVTLKAGASAGALGSWNGTNYAHMDSGTKVSNTAVVYTNQAAPTMKAFGEVYTTDYTAATRTLNVTEGTADANIGGSMFPATGTKTYSPAAPGGEDVSFPGTYDGAAGTYVCNTGGTPGACQATYTENGITLVTGGTWTFVHARNAMVSVADNDYLYFGWWLRKDKDGVPTSASAFFDEAGTPPTALTGVTDIAGSATYSGKAAGKFAIYNPLGGSEAGHFTANATLSAKFSGTGAGISGTIDSFMANDKSVPWSVALNNTGTTGTDAAEDVASSNNIGATGTIAAITDNAGTADVNESLSTVWSIDGNAASASGTWSGQMYDEAVGDADDGSNVPTSVLGTFQSMFGSTHTMVGAFGATKDE